MREEATAGRGRVGRRRKWQHVLLMDWEARRGGLCTCLMFTAVGILHSLALTSVMPNNLPPGKT